MGVIVVYTASLMIMTDSGAYRMKLTNIWRPCTRRAISFNL